MSKGILSLDIYGVVLSFSSPPAVLKSFLIKYYADFISLRKSSKVFLLDVPLEVPLVFERITFWINTSFYQKISNYLVLHAAAVTDQKKLIIFPGLSYTGKSTLATHFLLRGWGVLSDELVPISFKDKMACPYPGPIKLKGPSPLLKSLKLSNIDLEIFEDKKLIYINRPYLPNPTAKITAFIFPHFSPNHDFHIKRLNFEEKFKALLNNCVNFKNAPKEAFHLLLELAKGIPAYELDYRDLDHLDLENL